MLNKLKVIALDAAIKEMEELLKEYHVNIKTNEYFGMDNTHEKGVMSGIRAAVDVCYEVRKKFVKR